MTTLQLAKVFLFGQISRGGIELHCCEISFLIDVGCLKFTANADTDFLCQRNSYIP